ncbi:hypothetical protein PSP6_640006 [Paraburkholderia tropica]|nr:hypothetical protein PSP6_640006 [Paraburkholderia tropica]
MSIHSPRKELPHEGKKGHAPAAWRPGDDEIAGEWAGARGPAERAPTHDGVASWIFVQCRKIAYGSALRHAKQPERGVGAARHGSHRPLRVGAYSKWMKAAWETSLPHRLSTLTFLFDVSLRVWIRHVSRFLVRSFSIVHRNG